MSKTTDAHNRYAGVLRHLNDGGEIDIASAFQGAGSETLRKAQDSRHQVPPDLPVHRTVVQNYNK